MVSALLKQSWTLTAVMLCAIGQGMVITYPSCLLPALRSTDSPIKVDLSTASWIASCIGFSMLFGLIITCLALDRYGRRLTHIYMTLPGILGWLLIYFATNVPMLIIGRLLGGMTSTSTYVIGSVVIGEYSSPNYRGLFVNFKATFLCVGNMIVHILGIFLHWRTIALFSVIPLILSLCITCSWRESPSWLIKSKKRVDSENAFYWLRGVNDKSVKEYESMIQAQDQRNATAKNYINFSDKWTNFTRKLKMKNFAKPVTIMMSAFFLVEASGRHIFPVYAFDIMSGITVDRSQGLWFTLAIDALAIGSGGIASILIKLMKRRTLLFLSGIISVSILWTISLYLFLLSNGTLSNINSWILPSILLVYYIITNLGCIAIPLVIFAELFPLPHRETASVLSAASSSIFLSIALKTSPAMFYSLKLYGTFTLLSVFMILSLLYLYFTLPETKNRTLQEIEDYFNHGQFLDEEKARNTVLLKSRLLKN